MSMELLGNRKWKKLVTAFRAVSCATFAAWMYFMPAVMAKDPDVTDAKDGIYIGMAVMFNIAFILGIYLLAHGGIILALGHAEQQSPEQAKSLRELAAGAVLIIIRLIVPVKTLVDLFNVVTAQGLQK